VRIPSDPAHASLNLAQAVLILAYEVRLGTTDAATPRRAASVSAGKIEEAIDALREALLSIGYLNPQNPSSVLGEIRDLLFRGAPTAREVQLLRGLARQVTWAGKSARAKGLPADGSAED
jgi:tRNA/rRNA methyltransferase